MPSPAHPRPADQRPLRVLQVADVPPEDPGQPPWLVQHLWTHQAVGVLGGAPKSCKTFMALEIALAVASGAPCLGRFRVADPGPVLVFAAEDAPVHIRSRLQGLAQARHVDFQTLPVFLIVAEQLRLDRHHDLARLAQAVDLHRPRLLILDPLVRLHRLQENSAQEISALLADLRALQRRFGVAILLVHHTRKTNGPASGQDLRGSGDLHAWADSSLYLHGLHHQLRLTGEHRTARAPEPIALALTGDPPRLQIDPAPAPPQPTDLDQQILHALHRHPTPLTQAQLRDLLKVRNQSLTLALRQLHAAGLIVHDHNGWTLPQ